MRAKSTVAAAARKEGKRAPGKELDRWIGALVAPFVSETVRKRRRGRRTARFLAE